MLRKLLFGVASLILGCVFMASYLEIHSDIAQVQRDGKAAEIEPLVTYTKRTQKFISTFTAEIHFKTEQGEAIRLRHKEIPSEVIDVANQGRPVSILYLPSEPTRARFPQESASLLILGCGLFFLIVGLVMVGGPLRHIKEGHFAGSAVRTSERMTYNRSFDTDTQWHCAARRAGERTPRGAMPLRAGQLRR